MYSAQLSLTKSSASLPVYKGKESFGLKAGWQINSAISLNIYLFWLEIIFGCEIYEKTPPSSL